MWPGVLCCLLIAVVYVSCLYVKRTPASRQHPETVKWRIIAVLVASSMAWWPVYIRRQQVATRLDEVPTLLQLLGLQLDTDLLLASLLSLALTALLFAGPLFYKFPHSSESRQKQQHRSSHLQTLHALRDCVVAPLTEEWCFRACMVPLMWLEGASPTTIILVVPLFFGVCHLHHARELLLVHRQPLEHVLAMVCFQLLYTTVFGWYATWIFLKFGSYIPAVVVHAFCNWMGVPAFRAMAADDRAKALYATTAVGMVSFAVGLSMLTAQVGNRYLSVAGPRSKG